LSETRMALNPVTSKSNYVSAPCVTSALFEHTFATIFHEKTGVDAHTPVTLGVRVDCIRFLDD
jgi:hypothetical protein